MKAANTKEIRIYSDFSFPMADEEGPVASLTKEGSEGSLTVASATSVVSSTTMGEAVGDAEEGPVGRPVGLSVSTVSGQLSSVNFSQLLSILRIPLHVSGESTMSLKESTPVAVPPISDI